MDNKITNAFCRVDWARLRQNHRDKITVIGAKYNCKPLLPCCYEPKNDYIIRCTDEYKQWIAAIYKDIANLEPHLHALFDYYKDTDRKKAEAARWANKRCIEYHRQNPPQLATLPDWAQSTEGAQILNKLVEAGYCSHVGQLYQWNSTNVLWAFFADMVSDVLKLRGSNNRVPWRVIASAFDNITDDTIKQAIKDNSNRKNDYTTMPVGWNDIRDIINNIQGQSK